MPEFTTSDGIRLYFEDEGDASAPPLLCLAGLTRNSRDFDFVAPHLRGVRVIRMDYRGRGMSQRDPDCYNYSVLREAQDAFELLDYMNIGKVCVLGTSRGGLVAMMMAAGQGERLAGIVLNDVGPVVDPEGIKRIMEYVGLRPDFVDYDDAATKIMAATSATFPGVPQSVWRQHAEAGYIQAEDGLDLRYDPHLRTALIGQAAVGPPPDLWPLFDALQEVPLGVLRGANSDILTDATLAQMQARHPSLVSAIVPDRGHAPFLNEPESLVIIRRVLEAAT